MADWTYRDDIALELLGKTGDFRAYFKLYDDLFMIGTGGHIIQIEHPQHQNHCPIGHESILVAARTLKNDNSLTLSNAKSSLRTQLQGAYSVRGMNFIINLAVQAMLMIDCAANEYRSPDYVIGKYRHASWLPDEAFVDFVARCFPQVLSEHQDRVAMVLDDKRSLKAWKLKKRLGIEFKGTDNLADHLLFDPSHNILYLFHHTAYLNAHLDLCIRNTYSKDVENASTLKGGTLCPRLLAETMHSLQSILFRHDDDRSMSILQQLIKRKGFDNTCSVHDGYKMFEDSIDDFEYVYWGERLAVLHDLMLDRPPRTDFQRWIRWQTSESNSFVIAMLALIISIIVGILSLVLSAFQAWIAWQTWKHPS